MLGQRVRIKDRDKEGMVIKEGFGYLVVRSGPANDPTYSTVYPHEVDEVGGEPHDKPSPQG